MRKRTPRKRQLFPCLPCDIQGVQRWLEEMEAQGWALQSIKYWGWRPLYAVFQKTTPRTVRYRLQPADDFFPAVAGPYDAAHSQQDAYGEFGWDYAARLPDFYIYRTEDPAAPELHTDPEVQALALERLQKYYTRIFILGGSGLLVSARSKLRNAATIIEGCGLAIYLVYVVTDLLFWAYLIAKFSYYRRASADLAAGKPLPVMKHRKLWQRLLPVAFLLGAFNIIAMLWTVWRTAP